MAWFVAPALVQLSKELGTRWPGRDTTTDGSVGDTSHQAGVSDHNPDYSAGGIVRAIDRDDDGWPAMEVQAYILERCRSGQEKRLNYLIHNRRIYSAAYGWRERVYSGANAHESHIHFSLKHDSSNHQTHLWLPTFGGTATQPAEDEFMSDAQYKAVMDKLTAIEGKFGVGPGQRTSAGTQAATLAQGQANYNRMNAGFAALGADLVEVEAEVKLNADALKAVVTAALTGSLPDGADVDIAQVADAVVAEMSSRLAS